MDKGADPAASSSTRNDRDPSRTEFFWRLLEKSIPESSETGISQPNPLTDEIKSMLRFVDEMHNNSSEMMILRKISDVYSEAREIFETYASQNIGDTFIFPLDNYEVRAMELAFFKYQISTLWGKIHQISKEDNGVAGEKLEHSFSQTEGGSNSSKGSNISKVAEEKVVGFKEEVKKLLGKLLNGVEGGRLEIISIVGAAGGGKTTLAREVYDHPLISHTFEICAWVNICQDYATTMKRNLLIPILESASTKEYEDYEKFTDDELGEHTHKCLKGKKYLIVMDDIWGVEAWNDLQRSLPKECSGSKVLFTARLIVEPNYIRCIPHHLAPLSKSFSWELLQDKVFGMKCCPTELVGIGKHIAEKCQGLPLAIVAIAGILADKEKAFNVWNDVSKCLSWIIANNQDDCMKILELSYDHLPSHLKVCFVYFGGFPKDSEIIVRELIWLWIAEGFIQQTEGDKSLEDLAKDYLSNLIDRNLVMVGRKMSFGGIKTCRIHDLLHELCLKKAETDNFLVQINGNGALSPSTATKRCGLFFGSQFLNASGVRPSSGNLRSFQFLSLQSLRGETNLSCSIENLEILRVLRLISTDSLGIIGTGHLVYLRYLAIHLEPTKSDRIMPFFCLPNLETLYVHGLKFMAVPLPRDIDKMVNLRHLCAKRVVFTYHPVVDQKNEKGHHHVRLFPDRSDFDSSFQLNSLQTLHSICPCEECRNFLIRTPNLRKLGFYGVLISNDSCLMLPDIKFLTCLETLSINHRGIRQGECILPPVLKFPPTLMRLTFRYTFLKWEELSIFQTLPSLEVLKLSSWACLGPIWNASELDGFSQLKYLQLHNLEIEEWNASEDQFPRLEVLVVKHCKYLGQIPIELANLNELCKIEVRWSSHSAEESARKIQEERKKTRGEDGCINLLAANNKF